MSEKFVQTQQDISREAGSGPSSRIIKAQEGVKNSIRKFEMGKLEVQGQGTYEHSRDLYGPMAATDDDRPTRKREDDRFRLNPTTKERLAIEDEELRVIERRVEARVAERLALETQAAHDMGHTEGFAKGRRDAAERFAKEANDKVERLTSILHGIEEIRPLIAQANERQLVDLVFRVCRMILLKEIPQDREYLLRLTRGILERIGAKDNVRIRINPQDIGLVEELRAGLFQSFGALRNLDIEASTQVRLGGVELETPWNAIDASVDTQLQNIFVALMGEKALSQGSGTGTGEPSA